MFTGVCVCTLVVVMVKLAVRNPAGTVTVGGTWATVGLLLESATGLPPLGATPFNVTVPVEFCPPVTVLGESVSPTTPGGITMRMTFLTD